jgi:hypothetical protein
VSVSTPENRSSSIRSGAFLRAVQSLGPGLLFSALILGLYTERGAQWNMSSSNRVTFGLLEWKYGHDRWKGLVHSIQRPRGSGCETIVLC